MTDNSETKLVASKTQPKKDLLATPSLQKSNASLMYIIVPLMLFSSSAIMATAWLGHLRFKEDLTFLMAALLAWLLVLPEYALNIKALRIGYGTFTGGQMGAFRLCTGVACIAFVSHYILGEHIASQKILGFGIMTISMVLISKTDNEEAEA